MTATILAFPKKLKPKDEKYAAAVECYRYFDDQYQSALQSFEKDSKGVLSGMHNIFGEVSKSVKNVFLSFLNNPCPETWVKARSYLIDGSTTAWQLWVKYDHAAPRHGERDVKDERYPNPDSFLKYYQQHKTDRLESLDKHRQAALAIMAEYE